MQQTAAPRCPPATPRIDSKQLAMMIRGPPRWASLLATKGNQQPAQPLLLNQGSLYSSQNHTAFTLSNSGAIVVGAKPGVIQKAQADSTSPAKGPISAYLEKTWCFDGLDFSQQLLPANMRTHSVLISNIGVVYLGNVLIDAKRPTDMLLSPAVDRCHKPAPTFVDQRRRPFRLWSRRLPPRCSASRIQPC